MDESAPLRQRTAIEQAGPMAARSLLPRAATAMLLALMLLTPGSGALAASEAAQDDDFDDLRWYQVEVVLLLDLDGDRATREQLAGDHGPEWPADAHALGPIWPAPIRPTTVAEMRMLGEDPANAVRLQRVTPGLTLEDELAITELRRLLRRSFRDDAPVLPDLETLRWRLPDAEFLARGGDARITFVDPDAAPTIPVPAIAPTLTLITPDETLRAGGDPRAPGGADGDAGMPESDQPLATDPLATEPLATEPPDPDDIPIPLALAFREVADGERVLAPQARRLARSAGYRVVAHLAWRQPFVADAEALPVTVRYIDPVTDEVRLVGTVGVDLQRFLHVNLDLAWREQDADGEAIWEFAQQSRRMRSGELHYVDHPRIGALIRIDRFQLRSPLDPDGELDPVPIED